MRALVLLPTLLLLACPSPVERLLNPSSDDAHEPNDSPEQAAPLYCGVSINATAENPDWFAVETTAAGPLSVTLSWLDPEAELVLRLLDDDDAARVAPLPPVASPRPTRQTAAVSYDPLDGYEREDLLLAPDGFPPTVATLVRWAAGPPDADTAVLYLHGFNDYFFQAPYGPRVAATGRSFYALDLRRCGRSLRPFQPPSYVEDLSAHYEEIDAAIRRIRGRDGHRRLILHGHSTGGLTAALYAHDRADVGEVDALLLNAPFFDFRGPRRTRWPLKTVVPLLARFAPHLAVSRPQDPLYARSLHARYGDGGRWRYDEGWKRPGDLPYLAGFLAACRAGHRRVKAGLSIPCPILTLHSDRSGGGAEWNPSYHDSDVVLQVDKMATYAPRLGPRSEARAIPGALHDVFLSAEPVADQAWQEFEAWMERCCPA